MNEKKYVNHAFAGATKTFLPHPDPRMVWDFGSFEETRRMFLALGFEVDNLKSTQEVVRLGGALVDGLHVSFADSEVLPDEWMVCSYLISFRGSASGIEAEISIEYTDPVERRFSPPRLTISNLPH